MILRAGAACATLLLSLAPALASPEWMGLLRCSAEFMARAEYNRTLNLSNADHYRFLQGRSDQLLSLAEAVAPRESASCPSAEDVGPAMGLVLCTGPAFLWEERQSLVLERLGELSDMTKGNRRLPVCMEDETCAMCLDILYRPPFSPRKD